MIYLAGPLSHDYPRVERFRIAMITQYAVRLMLTNPDIYSPVTHNSLLYDHANQMQKERLTHGYIMKQCKLMLQRSQHMIVYSLPGWEESKGVTEELALAEKLGIGVTRKLPERDIYERYHERILPNRDPEYFDADFTKIK